MLAGLPLDRIAADGTPCLVLSERLLEQQIEAFREAARRHLPPHSIFYSVKTNDVQEVLDRMIASTDGLELVSLSELTRALAMKVPASRLISNGPNKSEAELSAAFAAGVGLVNLDGLADVKRAKRLAEKLGTRPRVGIRLAFREDKIWEKFGVSPEGEEFLAMIELLSRGPLELHALHFHGDPYLGSPGDLRPLLSSIADVRERLIARGFSIPILDLGGGWEPVIEIDERGAWKDDARTETAFRQIGDFFGERFGSDPPRLFLEPGRALVEGALVAIAGIGNIKRDRGTTFVFVDLSTYFVGGRHPCDRRVKFLLEGEAGEREPCMIAGPMCSGSDVLGEAKLGGASEGKRIIMANAGAYTLTLRWHGPLPHPRVVWVSRDGEITTIHER